MGVYRNNIRSKEDKLDRVLVRLPSFKNSITYEPIAK